MSSCGFAALADAVIKSGVNPELLVRLKEDEIHSLWLVRKRVQDEGLLALAARNPLAHAPNTRPPVRVLHT